MPDDTPAIRFQAPEGFDQWLTEHEDDSAGVWLLVARKSAPPGTITYSEAVAVALAHGWIDAMARREDDHSFRQRFTPRRRESNWSERNRVAVEAMIAAGTITPRGLTEVERARADGRLPAPDSA